MENLRCTVSPASAFAIATAAAGHSGPQGQTVLMRDDSSITNLSLPHVKHNMCLWVAGVGLKTFTTYSVKDSVFS